MAQWFETHFIWRRSSWPLKRPWFEIISFQSASNSDTASSIFCGASFFCIRISFDTFISSLLAKTHLVDGLNNWWNNLVILRLMLIIVWLKHHQLLIHSWRLFSPTLVPSYQVSEDGAKISTKINVNIVKEMNYLTLEDDFGSIICWKIILSSFKISFSKRFWTDGSKRTMDVSNMFFDARTVARKS